MSKPYATTVPFKIEHLDLIELRESEKEWIEANLDKYASLAQLGVGGTMMYDGRVLGAIGYYENWPGNFEVWVIPSKHVARHPAVFLRTIQAKLDMVARNLNVERFQSPAVSDEHHDKWMRHFGFVEEGVLRKYANGKDFKMWGRVNDVC